MTRATRIAIGAGAVAAVLVLWMLFGGSPSASMPITATNIATGVLLKPIADGTPDAARLRQGQYLLRAGDCMVCHTREGGAAFAGGYPLNTPFGVIFSTNLTPDKATGIGALTADEFYAALHDGKGAHGPLYPAMPYPYFTRVTRADSDAMFAYLRSIPAVNASRPANALHFPFSIRALVHVWNAMNFSSGTFVPDASKPAAWNRGAYLVTGLGHCGACHTPKNFLAGDKTGHAYQGGDLDNWLAPDLTSNGHTGLGGWSAADIVEYLKTGRNAHANAGGPMADVVTYSTSLLSDADLQAIATYLRDLPPSKDGDAAAPDAKAMQRGAAVYSDACTSCHMENGVGQPRIFPPLRGNRVSQQSDPTTLLHLILAGGRTAPTATRPSPLSMPSFAWKLDDQQVADVASFVRNSWGNHASPVTAKQVARLREGLRLDAEHLTDNSTDR